MMEKIIKAIGKIAEEVNFHIEAREAICMIDGQRIRITWEIIED